MKSLHVMEGQGLAEIICWGYSGAGQAGVVARATMCFVGEASCWGRAFSVNIGGIE